MTIKRLITALLFVGAMGVTAVGCIPSDLYGYPGSGHNYGPAAHHYNYSLPNLIYGLAPAYRGYNHRRSGRINRGHYRNRGAGYNRSRARGLNLPRRRRVYGAGVNRAGLRGIRPSGGWTVRRRHRVSRWKNRGVRSGGAARTYRRSGGQVQSGQQSGGSNRRRRRR